MVITSIYFVSIYGKGFPVDSSPCIYLMVHIPPPWSEFDFLFCVAGVRLVSYHGDLD